MTASRPVLPSQLLRHGLVGSSVTAMSIASRVLALLLLVPAARVLSLADFGTFSLVLGFAVATANVIGSAPSDLIATRIGSAPRQTWMRVVWSGVVSSTAGLGLVGVAATLPADAAVVVLGVSIGVTSVVPVLAMSLLRGLERPLLGAGVAFLVLPVARAVAAVVAGDTLVALLMAVAVVGVVVGVLATVAVGTVRPVAAISTAPEQAPRRAAHGWIAVSAGLAVSVAWFALAQSGPLWLATAAGPAAVAAVVPTLRLCEALTAIGIGYKAAANRALQATADGAFPRGTVVMLIGAFALAAGVTCAVSPVIVPIVFGPELHFAWPIVLPLLSSAALAMLIAVKVQLLFAVGASAQIARSAGLAAVVAVAASGGGAVVLGAPGVALAMALTTATWLAMLLVRHRPEHPGC